MEEGTLLNNRYRLTRLLGRGGMADVYLAFDERRQAAVALKLLREDLAEDPEFVRRFQREAAALARLDHPNIVRFYGFEQAYPRAWIVMDYVPGATLRRRLGEAGGPLALAEVSGLVRQVGAALSYAHAEGIVHRDLKPANIMLKSDGTALLSDFGIARAAEATTMTAGPVGTPAYMAPEQILGQAVDGRTDVYGLGAVVWELVTGRRLFSGETGAGTTLSERVRDEHLHAAPGDPCALNPALPQAAAQVLLRALAKDPDQRWPDMVSFVRAWENALGLPAGSTAPGRPPAAVLATAVNRAPEVIAAPMPQAVAAKPGTRRRPTVIAAAVIGCAATLAVAALVAGLRPSANTAAAPRPTATAAARGQPAAILSPTPAAPTPELAATAGAMAMSMARQTADAQAAIDRQVAALAAATSAALSASATVAARSANGTATAIAAAAIAARTADAQAALANTRAAATASVVRATETALVRPMPTATPRPPTPTASPALPRVDLAFVGVYPNEYGREVVAIYEGNPNPVRLTEESGDDGYPAISPTDRTLIAFEVARDGLESDIWIMNSDGTNKRRLTDDPALDAQPAFSPDGRRIAFISERTGEIQVHTMRIDGSDVRHLPAPGACYAPSYSPDGKQIVFVATQNSKVFHVYAINVDGSGLRRITTQAAHYEHPSFSADGRFLVFQSDALGAGEIMRMEANGAGLTNLTNNPAADSEPAWSPDDSQIAFTRVAGNGMPHIWLMNRDGANQHQLTSLGLIGEFQPAWAR